jgi:hypothetical protein
VDTALIADLHSKGVTDAAREMGLSVERVFLPLAESVAHPYRRYRWSVARDEAGRAVIHALPPEEEVGWTPWERWSMVEDQARRQSWVLYPLRPAEEGAVGRWYRLDDGDDPGPRLLARPDNLASLLKRARVFDAAATIGFEAEPTLLGTLGPEAQRRYIQYRWVVIPHSLAADGPVIYALPPMHLADRWPWESWYGDDHRPLIHHVHFTAPHPRCTNQWRESIGAPQRPPEVFGATWWWYDDPSMTPAMVGAG